MKNKKVLIITPFFAPESHAAVFRAHKFVKYLKKEGWEPIVLTVDTNYLYNEDSSLLEELGDTPIYRTRYIEPSLRGLYMRLTGKDRTYKTIKVHNSFSGSSPSSENKAKAPKSWKYLYNYLLAHHLNNPDRFWTWKRGAIKKARCLIRENDVQFVYTSCLPFTTNEIGIALKKTENIYWIADFRDPITYAQRMHSKIGRVFLNQKKIQDETFLYADKVTVLSSSYKLIFNDQYEGKFDNKIIFIPTGIDDEYLPTHNRINNEIIFVGEYLKEYKDDFFKIFKRVIALLPEHKVPILKIIGNTSINEKVVLPLLKDLNLLNRVELVDHMPQKDLYLELSKAKYVLILAGHFNHWWCNFAKLVDYIALQKLVVALVPTISEARSELEKTKRGIFLEDNFEQNIEILYRLFSSRGDMETPANDYYKRYFASTQTKEFVKVLEKLEKL